MSLHCYRSSGAQCPENSPVTVCAWNRIDNVIACGHKNGFVSFSRVSSDGERPGFDKLRIVATSPEHKNEITGVVWNERYGRLITTDVVGFLVIWYQREGKWTIWNVGERTGFKITSLACSDNGELVSLGYENGLIVVGSSEVETRWTAKLDFGVVSAAWISDMKELLVGTEQGHLFSVTSQGTQINEIGCPSEVSGHGIRQVTTSYKGDAIVAFDNCHFVQMCVGESPVSVDAGVDISAVAWSRNGQMFAVAGRDVDSVSVNQIRLYEVGGELIRTYKIQTASISSLSFDGTGMKLVAGVGRSISVITILSLRPYHFFRETIVYSCPVPRSTVSTVVFFNTKSGDQHTRRVDALETIAGTEDVVVLVSSSKSLILLNEFGIPQASFSCEFDVRFVAIDGSCVCAASESEMLLWDYKKDEAQKRNFTRSIAAVAARNNLLFVAFTSCELMCYSLPALGERSRYNLPFVAVTISLSLDGTRVSLIDADGMMSFLDVHSGTCSSKDNARSETWCARWASDHPDYFASVERQRIYLYHKFTPYESINSMTNVCQMKDLVLQTVDFVKLLSHPLQPKLSYFHTYETKPLRDMKSLLQSKVDKDEIFSYVESMDHPVMWKMLAEFHLGTSNFACAEKSFKRIHNVQVDMFVNFLSKLQNEPRVYKGVVLWYLQMHDKAEEVFSKIGRVDLIAKMRASTGEWKRVIDITDPKDGNINRAQLALAKQYRYSSNFAQAAHHYGLAGDVQEQLRCLFKAKKFEELCSLLASLNPKDHASIVKEMGILFKSIGCSDKAVEAFLMLKDYKAAVDTCLELKNWTLVMKLLKDHQSIPREPILLKFTTYLLKHGKVSAALDVLVRNNMKAEAAKLLENEGDTAYRSKRFVRAKKCYVFGAMYDPKLWHKAEAVHYLIVAHRFIYNKCYTEALEVSNRLVSSYADIVGEEVPAVLCTIAGLNSHYFRVCSRGLTTLEHSRRLSQRKIQVIRDIGVRIFAKAEPFNPEDAPTWDCPECQRPMTFPQVICRCGYTTTPSIVTGASIGAQESRKCQRCRHLMLETEFNELSVCPLCHFVMK